ncbi:lantibiotic dehydratase C-terminal domain-containing protein [Lentibacillus sp. CBA3610]|uniref:lantibiotic dehydratase C-terminal domain-containing protein n=1 Tax=Lentibacillus sp. CBA3610 TaxID=2518176 RepID=UPI001595B511|nr:lantibiotic dehydratase C-terminal domain-containing protein [Lentibacillus sp. CBA3610]QKY71292.1 hypothetical protein Len3610_18595 [Lentibacillus sp. CBA3610]
MWYSLHGYIHDYKALDVYLKHDFEQFIKQTKLEKFFFIRYWLGGPHVRLRFKCKEENYKIIKECFADSIREFLKYYEVNLVDKYSFYDNISIGMEGVHHTYWCKHGSVVEIDYNPEYDRYGGRDSMSDSEDVFCESSKMALKLNKLDFTKRIILGFDLIYLSFERLDNRKTAIENYRDFWRNYAVNSNIKKDQSFRLKYYTKRLNELRVTSLRNNKLYSEYINSLEENGIFNEYSLLMSHVHMTNNRLGISPSLEYELADNLLSVIVSQ